MSEENSKSKSNNAIEYKEHTFSLVDSFFEFAVLVVGILYTVWNCVDLFQAIANQSSINTIVTSAFDVIAKAVPFVILLVVLECHEKLSYIEDNLSATTDYVSEYNNRFDEQLCEIYELLEGEENKDEK